jgi:hypothetical protein
MEATCSSETSADFQRTTWRYITEAGIQTSFYIPLWVSALKVIKLRILERKPSVVEKACSPKLQLYIIIFQNEYYSIGLYDKHALLFGIYTNAESSY